MFVFYGDCQKHDLVLTVAIALQTLTQKPVTVISDDDRSYKYFNGDISGVSIGKVGNDYDGMMIYDCHKVIIPPLEGMKLVVCTDFSKHSVDVARSVYNKLPVKAVMVSTQDSSISEKYVETYIGNSSDMYSYEDDPVRRIDMEFEGRMRFKNMNDDFLKAIGKMLVDVGDFNQKDIKELWPYLKRRVQ